MPHQKEKKFLAVIVLSVWCHFSLDSSDRADSQSFGDWGKYRDRRPPVAGKKDQTPVASKVSPAGSGKKSLFISAEIPADRGKKSLPGSAEIPANRGKKSLDSQRESLTACSGETGEPRWEREEDAVRQRSEPRARSGKKSPSAGAEIPTRVVGRSRWLTAQREPRRKREEVAG